MKTFLTLLAVITSLSAYTLVGVHAGCAHCPKTLSSGASLTSSCTNADRSITSCVYASGKSTLNCAYTSKGVIKKGSNVACPASVHTDGPCGCSL
ncbi:hypothetical protein BDN67DRAFT_971213 [Paxillus ammoniavirescens]|nr:hypothetical protein BDN67DRAFT_971213 [Paxillus ammoniavirescens]